MSRRQRGSGSVAAIAVAAALLSSAASARPTEGFTAPGAGQILSPGAIVELRWASACETSRLRGIDEAELLLSLDGGTTFPIRVSPELRPCASRYLWKVPALPAARARLALRNGLEERDRTESVELVSAEFRILAEPDGRVEELRRRALEWWVLPDPAALTADDLLERRLGSPQGALVPPADRPAAAVMTAVSAARPPERPSNPGSSAGLAEAVSLRAPCARPAGAPTPLRL